jgi:hypothetical protein
MVSINRIEQKTGMPRWVKGAATAVSLIALSGIGLKLASDGLEGGYCQQPTTIAPDGNASSTPLCEMNDDFRNRVSDVNNFLHPQIIKHPVFDIEG